MRVAYLIALIVLVFVCVGSCAADGPPVSTEGKLFGLVLPKGESWDPALTAAYEKSGATAAALTAEWGKIEPSDPGSGASNYDFAAFDDQPFAKSAKTRICWIDLGFALGPQDKSRSAEAFITELVKHANAMGIKHFAFRIKQENPASSVDFPTESSAERLKLIYKAVKAVSKEDTVIAVQPYSSGANAIEILYRIGAKGSFDVAAIHAVSKAGGPVDPFQLVAAHRELARNGEGQKKLLIIGGWEPKSAARAFADKQFLTQLTKLGVGLQEQFVQAVQQSGDKVAVQSDVTRETIESDLRNILTERDIYDPAWVLGEIVYLPEKPTAEFVAAFPPKPYEAKLEAQISSEGPIFNYVTEKPYKLTLTLTNLAKEEMKLDGFSAAIHWPKEMSVKSQLEGSAPGSIPVGGSATINFTIALPKEAAGQQITLVGSVDYTVADRKRAADCWLTVMATPQFEVTLLPARLVLDPREGAKRVGMSVINHTEAEFQGKITLMAYPGITVIPAQYTTNIDPLGLEAFVYSVTAEKTTAPGHYAVFVDVDGKGKEWQAVDVPVVAKKVAGKIAVDGKLDDRKDASSFTITKTTPKTDGTTGYEPVGKGWIEYDDSVLYVAIEVNDAKHVKAASAAELPRGGSVLIGFDPLMNGARREDDYEFALGDTQQGPVVLRTQVPASKATGVDKNVQFAFRNEGGKSVYEAAFPWSELDPLKAAKGTTFAMALLVNLSGGAVEWGGGLTGAKDPRMFVPVALGE